MANYKIFSVGFALPNVEYVDFESDRTLLDADIILFKPTLGKFEIDFANETYRGKALLSERSSFQVRSRIQHWKSEISIAIRTGKAILIFLGKPSSVYAYTGRKEYSGTGRSRIGTNLVEQISSYECIPGIKSFIPKSGKSMQITKDANIIAPYWKEFSVNATYEVEIEGDFSNVLLTAGAGSRVVGAASF